MSNYDAEYMEDVDDEMEEVDDDLDDEFRGDEMGASDSDVDEFDYSVSMLLSSLLFLLFFNACVKCIVYVKLIISIVFRVIK